MPLNALWGFTVTDHLDETGWLIKSFWVVGLVCFGITVVFCTVWIVQDRRAIRAYLLDKRRAVEPVHNMLATTIVVLPIVIAALSLITLVRPVTALPMELMIAILSSVNVSSLAHYFLLALGEPPLTENLLSKVSAKRWWCGSLCGGVSDTMPGLGLMWSKEAHQLSVEDLHAATVMVKQFMFFFILSNVISSSLTMVPTAIVQEEDGWCTSQLIGGWILTLTGVMAVWSSFVGMSGFSIISAGVATALEEAGEKAQSLKVGKKACAAQIYMLLPLLLPILLSLPIRNKAIGIPVAITESAKVEKDGNWSHSGRTIVCPVFDQQVCAHLLYSLFVLVAMAVLSYINFRLFAPGDDTHLVLPSVCGECGDAEDSQSDLSQSEEEMMQS